MSRRRADERRALAKDGISLGNEFGWTFVSPTAAVRPYWRVLEAGPTGGLKVNVKRLATPGLPPEGGRSSFDNA